MGETPSPPRQAKRGAPFSPRLVKTPRRATLSPKGARVGVILGRVSSPPRGRGGLCCIYWRQILCGTPLALALKNEGASGDVHENKGTGKFLAPNARKYGGGFGVRTLRHQKGLDNDFSPGDSLLAGISREVYENKGTGKYLAPKPRKYNGASASERYGTRRGPDPDFRLLDSFLAGISREVYENKGTGKILPHNTRKYTRGPVSARGGSRRSPDPHFQLLDSLLAGISR